jgi:hypothetical protein
LLLFLTGCFGGEGDEKRGSVAEKYQRDSPEYRALRDANPNPKNFKKALRKREIEELKAEGVVVKSTTSRKVSK